MKTKVTLLLGIKYPVLQGGMAWSADGRLAAAVSNAGGAGIIGTGGRTTEWVRQEIAIAKQLTNKPFGVNVMLMAHNKEDIINLAIREKISFVSLGAGDPTLYIKKLQAENVKVIPVVPHLRAAKKVERLGADAIVIEGMESGGHVGALTTMAQLTNIIPHINVPVIAAGGIADGRGVAAALLMGADGVQMGSRFLLAEECPIHEKAKTAIVQGTDTDSVVTGYGKRHAVRGLKNAFSSKFLAMEAEGSPQSDLDQLASGTLRKAMLEGDVENGYVNVGQSICALTRIQPAAEILEELMAEARITLSNGLRLLGNH